MQINKEALHRQDPHYIPTSHGTDPKASQQVSLLSLIRTSIRNLAHEWINLHPKHKQVTFSSGHFNKSLQFHLWAIEYRKNGGICPDGVYF